MDETGAPETTPESTKLILKAQIVKFLILIGILTIFNTVSFAILPLDNRTITERLSEAVQAFVFSFPVLGFILGLLVALIPYKGLSYGDKYLRSSVFTILILQALIFVMMIMNIILFSYNGN